MALLAPQRLDPRRQGDTFRPDTIRWVLTDDDLSELQLAIKSCTVVVVDLETMGLDPYATFGGATNGGYPARVVLASFTLPREDEEGEEPTTWVLPLSHPDSPWLGSWRRTLGRVAEQIAASARPVVNANVKFDAKWIYAHTQIDLSALIVWDTQISSHLLDETESTRLKERVPATFGVQRWDDFDLSKPGAAERVPMFDLGVYAARDTAWTHRLYELHIWLMNISEPEEPDDPDALELARIGRLADYVAMPTVRSLTAIEQRGFRLDVEWVREHLAECQDTSRTLIDKLSTRYGMDPATASFAPTSKWFLAWTEAALAAGDLIVGGLTATGRPQWDKAVLVRQSRAGSDVATDLLEMRGAIKRAEYLTSWLGQVTPAGKIHATYHAGRVITGRLSSSDPNMQQVTKSLKPAFVPRAGNVIAELDFSQIELRVAAFISRCGPMLEAFRQGHDLHRLLGARLTGKAPEDVTPEERQKAKAANFGLLYQMSPGGFQSYAETAYGVAMTQDEAAAVHQAFYDMWDGIGAWHLRSIKKARMTGRVVSPIGRVRRLPDINSYNDRLVGWSERSAVNSPVQGFASDLMQLAAAWIGGFAPGHAPVWDAEIVATVHDSIVIEAPADRWEPIVRQCMDRMVRVGELLTGLDCHLDVPLAVEAKVGTRWGLSDVGSLH
jgi:DNA polymerase-1